MSQISNSFVMATNEKVKFPKAVIIPIDTDIMNTSYKHYGDTEATNVFGKKVEWLLNEMHSIILIHRDWLTPKAIKEGYPKVIWIAPPLHALLPNNQQIK